MKMRRDDDDEAHGDASFRETMPALLKEKLLEIAEELMPTSALNSELKFHVGLVRSTVEAGKLGKFCPRLVLTAVKDDETGMVLMKIPDLPESNSDKKEVMRHLGLAAAGNDVQVLNAILEVEAWSRQVHEGDPDAKKIMSGDKRVSETPDKREIILLTSMTMDGRNAFAMIPIKGRNADGSLVLGKEDVHESDSKTTCQDSLLAAFWDGFAVAEGAKLAAKLIKARGGEVPPEIVKILEMLKSAPRFQKVE